MMSNENRYSRQLILQEIGEAGMQKLHHARVLIIGAGGLGSPVSLYLAAAGVGCIGIVEHDVVSISNLNRQILYTETQMDRPKALCAVEQLRQLNSDIDIVMHDVRIDSSNALQIVSQYDMVVDACDNFATRYLIGDVTAAKGMPYIYGAVGGLDGQVSVFNYGTHPRTYRDLWPDEEMMLQYTPSKAIVGVTAGVIGCIQANEVLKIICGYGEVLASRLWSIDLRTLQTQIVNI